MTDNHEPTVPFATFWDALNMALVAAGQRRAAFSEARAWYEQRPIKFVDQRLVNRIVDDRRPD